MVPLATLSPRFRVPSVTDIIPRQALNGNEQGFLLLPFLLLWVAAASADTGGKRARVEEIVKVFRFVRHDNLAPGILVDEGKQHLIVAKARTRKRRRTWISVS